MQFVIITGLSGAGKSTAVHVFEDMGYFCVDNLPPVLVPRFAELVSRSHGRVDRVAVVMDIRSGEFFDEIEDALRALDERRLPYRVLFLDASDEVLVRRFKETRRKHPLAPSGSVLEGIQAERRRLETLRERAHKIVDTSTLTPQALRTELQAEFGPTSERALTITVLSFGYKHGLPMDADLVFDVRFLPNPHYVPELRPHPGTHPEVRAYVLASPEAQTFRGQMLEMVSFLLPHFIREGKSHLVIAIGCTGGRHRSVVFAEELGSHLRELGYAVRIRHRDLDRE
ncbi:MAG: RNase adapter RapZ [Armatimonadota bacterium]|nr:RNase adapter RapZ [Armatimonadota bacterium]MDR7443439.1 RNase adapter RapZ [Armatimonadota bacterium]MDR7569278.1 RNase adapter RapZ [Armatimonadota bacterium]MDR7614938.1 RNase adapter RapZ [Armatimonadota bacterium]